MKRLFLVLSFTLLIGVTILAQTPTGQLLGTVSGPDGVLPGATVTIKFNQTGKTQTTVTDGSGAFSVSQLEPGLYTVTVTSNGFKTFVANEVKIDISRDYTLPVTLEIGSVQESVTVTAGADVITSTSAQVTSVVSPQQILSLPLLTRNPLSLTTLQAGVASNPFQNTAINGQRTTLTNITRDGISINDQFIRTNATDFAPGRPSVDDTGEFTISTTNQESDSGSGGAQITLVTPRGQKDFHGALFAYNRNSHFAANNFFNNRSTDAAINQKPPFRNRNQYGGRISGPFLTPRFGEGGPVWEKNKGFFFFAYEGIKDPLAQRYTRTILTPAARTGAFTFTRATAGDAFNQNGISCPTTTVGSICTVSNILAFAQSVGMQGIPSAIDPTIQSLVLGPMPTTSNTTGGDSLNTTGYALNRRFDTTRNTYTARVDVDGTANDQFNAVFSWNKENVLRPDVDVSNFSTVPDVTQYSKNKMFTVSYRRILSNSMVNEARWGIFTSEVPFKRISPYPAFFLGGQGTTSGTLAGLVDQPNIFLDQGRNNKLFTLADNFNWVVGKHSLKFGVQFQKYKVNSYNDVLIIPNYIIGPTSVNAATSTSFTTGNFPNIVGGVPTGTVISTAQAATASNLLALLGGIVNQRIQGFNTSSPTSGYQPVRNLSPFRNSNHAAYASDRWTVARGLTLSLGVRWEIYPAMRLKNGLSLEPVISNPNDPAGSLLAGNGTFDIIGTNAGKKYLYYKTDYNNFAPSLGIAYSPNFESGIGKFLFGGVGKSVIRGGYSEIYGNDSIITSLNNTLSGNVGLGRASNSAIGPNGTAALNDRLGGNNTPILPPAFVNPPRSFLQNNTAGQGFFGVANAVDPKLEIPKTQQYSVGWQREFWGNTAVEIRYVGTRSNNLARGIDLNEIDVVNNGFLSDFQKAQANLALSMAANGGNVNASTPFCAGVVTGCVALNIFQNGGVGSAGHLVVGGAVSLTTFRTNLQNGTVADLAQLFISNNLNNHPTLASPGNAPFVKFYANPNIGQIELFTNAGSYNYNSLQFEIRRRFSQGLYFQANYTFSKNLTDTIGTSQQLFEPYLQNNNRKLDKQRADFDQTHVFNFNGIYQLPFGKGKWLLNYGGLADKLFGGWELSGLMQMSTGAPITFIDTRGTLNRGARSGRQTAFSTLTNEQIRALSGIFEANGRIYFINPSVIGTDGRAATGYIYTGLNSNTAFNGQAFFNVAPGQTGNLGRTLLNGPRYVNVNMALLKNIKFTEGGMRLQLRAEAFNVFNFVNLFNNTQFANINSTTFGQITSAGDPRIFQFAARFEF
ncbi:MAG: carboxypeptidase regulatory-like domain-containing protein [Acidobacteria bacterium]|nr:carboxypeptidase regulatory-like domain-containing protein [Acidobacteriota bacterium]